MMSLTERPIRDGQPLSWRFLIVLLLALTAAQLLLYSESFLIKPCNDDFGGPITDINRAEMEGPLSLFLASNQPKNYRPLQSFFMWLAGRWSMPEPWLAEHALGFASMFVLGLSVIAWMRHLPLRPIGAVVAGIVAYMHPALTPQLAPPDGFAGLIASAMMWSGALAVYLNRERPLAAAVLASAFLLVGSLFKEYTFGLVPLALWTAIALPSRRRVSLILALLLALGACMIALMWVRRVALLPGHVAEVPTPSLDPMQLGENLALFAAVLFYFGHTAWVYVHRDALSLGVFAASTLATLWILMSGLWLRFRQWRVERADMAHSQEVASPTIGAWILYFALSVIPAGFPANVMAFHVSEMYAGAMIVPVAFLLGFAACGFSRGPRLFRTLAWPLLLGQLALALAAVQQKVSDMRDIGDRADHMAKEFNKAVPPDVHNETVGLAFLKGQWPKERMYSFYRMRDADLLLPGLGSPWIGFFEWVRPGNRIYFDPLVVDSIEQVDRSKYRLLYLWDAEKKTISSIP